MMDTTAIKPENREDIEKQPIVSDPTEKFASSEGLLRGVLKLMGEGFSSISQDVTTVAEVLTQGLEVELSIKDILEGELNVSVDLGPLQAIVENILTETEAIKGVLEGELSVDFSALETIASTISDEVTAIKTALEGELSVDLSELISAVDAIKAELEAAGLVLGEIKTELDALSEIKTELETANVTLGEIKAGIDALEFDVDVDLSQLETTTGEIKTELETANVTLGEIKTAIEELEIDVDFTQLETTTGEIKTELQDVNNSLNSIEADLSEIKPELANLSAIKSEAEIANGNLARIESEIIEGVKTLNKTLEEITRGTIKLYSLGSEIGASYTTDPLVSLNTENKALFAISIKNTGANPLDFEVKKRAKWGASIGYLFASQEGVAPGASAEFPIEGAAFAGRFDVFIKSASGTTATVETIIKTGPKSQLAFECDWTVGNGGDFATIPAALACITVKDGDRLLLLNGEYNLTSTLTIGRRISLVGESRQGVVIKNDPTWTNGGSLISVTADGVSFEHLTISQTSSNANAFAISGQKAGEQKLQGFSLIKCDIEYSKHAVWYRAADFVVYDCYFELIPGGSGTRYALMPLANSGNSFIDSCVFDHPLSLINNNRLILMGGGGSALADKAWTGSITVSRCTDRGFVSQFINHDSLVGAANSFDLIVHSNTINETNAFVAIVGTNVDLYRQAIFYANKLTNVHAVGNLGKGMFFISSNSIRAAAMPFFAANNELQNLALRATEVDAPNSPAGQSLATISTTAAAAYIAAGRNPIVFSDRIPRRLPQLDLKFWS